jgi:hypothetical protein
VLVDDWHLAWVQEMQQECDRDEARLASEVSIDRNERIVGSIRERGNRSRPASLQLGDQQLVGWRDRRLIEMTVLP